MFKKLRGMPAGHVAVVTGIVNGRMIKVSHANWTSRGAKCGRVERDIAIFDESLRNDWTQVRVWYAPSGDYGLKVYPTYGFIYPGPDTDVSGSES